MGKNRELPIYQRQVKLQPAQEPSEFGAANAIINSFQQFSGAVAQATVQLTNEQAKRERDMLQHNISTTLRQFYQEAMEDDNPNKGLRGYDQKVNDYMSGMLDTSHHFNKDYIKNNVEYYSTAHREPLLNKSIQFNRRQSKIDFAIRDNQRVDDMFDAVSNSKPIVTEDGIDLQFAASNKKATEILEMRHQAAQAGIIDKLTSKEINDFYRKYTDSVWMKTFEDHMKAGKTQDFWESFNKSSHLHGYSPEQKQILVGKLLKVESQYKKELGFAEKQLTKRIDDAYKTIQDGGDVPDGLRNDIQYGRPNYLSEFDERVEISKQINSIKEATVGASPVETQQLLDDIRPKDPKAKDYILKKDMYLTAVKQVQNQEQAIRNDPVEYATQDPTVQKVGLLNQNMRNAGDEQTDLKNTPYNVNTPQSLDAMYNWQISKGFTYTTFKPMTKANAKARVIAFNQQDARGKLQMLDDMRDEFHNAYYYSSALRQMHKDGGLPASMVSAAGIDPTSPYAQDVMEALERPVDEYKKLLDKDTLQDIHDSVQNSVASPQLRTKTFKERLGFNPIAGEFHNMVDSVASYQGGMSNEFQSQLFDTLNKLSLYAYNKGIVGNIDDAVQWGQQQIAGKYQFTSLHGQPIRMLKVNPDNGKPFNEWSFKLYAAEKEKGLDKVDWDISDKFFNRGALVTGDNAREVAMQFIRNGHWATDPLDHGVIWVAQNGVVPRDKNGQPYFFSFEEAEDHFVESVTRELIPNEDARSRVKSLYNLLMGEPKPFINTTGTKGFAAFAKDGLPMPESHEVNDHVKQRDNDSRKQSKKKATPKSQNILNAEILGDEELDANQIAEIEQQNKDFRNRQRLGSREFKRVTKDSERGKIKRALAETRLLDEFQAAKEKAERKRK